MVAGDVRILDLVSANEDAFQIAAHTPVRVWIEGNTLRTVFLESDWLKEQARQQIPVVLTKDRLIMTAPGEAVAKFLAKFGADPKAAGDDPDSLRRIQ